LLGFLSGFIEKAVSSKFMSWGVHRLINVFLVNEFWCFVYVMSFVYKYSSIVLKSVSVRCSITYTHKYNIVTIS